MFDRGGAVLLNETLLSSNEIFRLCVRGGDFNPICKEEFVVISMNFFPQSELGVSVPFSLCSQSLFTNTSSTVKTDVDVHMPHPPRCFSQLILIFEIPILVLR